MVTEVSLLNLGGFRFLRFCIIHMSILATHMFVDMYMMGDVLLYVVNICFSYWLMSKAVSANGQAGFSHVGYRNIVGGVPEMQLPTRHRRSNKRMPY